jgi:Putative zinc-finger
LRQELGVYVLGAIGPADRSEVDMHLASCTRCRDELAGLPALLGRIPAGEVDGPVLGGGNIGRDELPPDQSLGSLLSLAAGLRKNRTWRQLAVAVAAGVVVGAGTVASSRALEVPGQPPAVSAPQAGVTVRGSEPQSAASATGRYLAQPRGIEFYVQVRGIAAGTTCTVTVMNASGQETLAGSWTVAAGQQDAWYPASSSVQVSGLRGFVVAAAGRARVRVPVPLAPTHAGGSR